MSTIGSRIRTRREELGMSQDELAQKLQYRSRSSVNKIELDQRDLPQSKIKSIADALLTTPAYIMGWDEKEEAPANTGASPRVEELVRLLDSLPDKALDKAYDYISMLHELNK